MKKQLLYLILLISLLGIACQSKPKDSQDGTNQVKPQWITSPPLENDFFYGVGTGETPAEARQRAVIDAGQQFSVQVKSTFQESTIEGESFKDETVNQICNLSTDMTVYGIKFTDQYVDRDGMYWVLSKAPVSCLLDTVEGMIISYSLDIRQQDSNVTKLIESIENKTGNPDLRIGKSDRLYRDLMFEEVDFGDFSERALMIRKIPDQDIGNGSDLTRIPWGQFYYAYDDSANDQTDRQPYSDLKEVRFAFDSEYLYMKVDLFDSTPSNRQSWYQTNIKTPGQYDQFFDFALRYDQNRWITELRIHKIDLMTNEHDVNTIYKDLCTIDGNSIIGRVKLESINLKEGDVREFNTHTHNGEYDPDAMNGEYLHFVENYPIEKNRVVISQSGNDTSYIHPDSEVIPIKTITIDGQADDWEGIDPLYSSYDDKSQPEKTIKNIYAARGNAFLYLAMEMFAPPAVDETVYAIHIQNFREWDSGDLEIGYRVWNGSWRNQWNKYLGNGNWTGLDNQASYEKAGKIIEFMVPMNLLKNLQSVSLQAYVHMDDSGDKDSTPWMNIRY